jgi:hypothetical protein
MPMDLNSKKHSFKSLVLAVALVIFGALYAIGYLKLPSRWWFEDDGCLYSYAAQISNPITIFMDPQVVSRFTTGQALVPMQIMSYWIDVRLSGFSPKFSYAHQIFIYLITLFLLYFALAYELPQNRIAAFVLCILWSFLPATAVVLQFLSTRHYLEGFFFIVLMFFLLQRVWNYRGCFQWIAWIAIFLSAIAALFYKEIYVPVVPGMMLWFAWRHKEKKLGAASILLLLAYAGYRFWIIGPAFSYGMPVLSLRQYIRLLFKLPYTISANYGGYCILAFVAGFFIYCRRKEKQIAKFMPPLFVTLFLSLAVIYPVCYPLYGSIRTPGTWYRIVFLLHSIALLATGILMGSHMPKKIQAAAALMSLILILPGTYKTKMLWVNMTANAEREGKFYLNNPDKLILSEQAASWFLGCVDSMYLGSKSPHYIHIGDLPGDTQTKGNQVWRFQNGRFIPIPWPPSP